MNEDKPFVFERQSFEAAKKACSGDASNSKKPTLINDARKDAVNDDKPFVFGPKSFDAGKKVQFAPNPKVPTHTNDTATTATSNIPKKLSKPGDFGDSLFQAMEKNANLLGKKPEPPITFPFKIPAVSVRNEDDAINTTWSIGKDTRDDNADKEKPFAFNFAEKNDPNPNGGQTEKPVVTGDSCHKKLLQI